MKITVALSLIVLLICIISIFTDPSSASAALRNISMATIAFFIGTQLGYMIAIHF